ncbi:phosphoribosylamine--glycine ligase [Rhabdaerophilum calidifontis]|uniref:phosphoribosylamine--glycine ligase n=1 Tax=Rhabdaerophilum calidifontis TaxID=2604328 RepID=UPI00123B9B04|nr:phosphoribosylamine--glycine ligase [Rhabdaerophilum calidifontis]
MNVLLIGNGGREHALAHAITRSPRLGTLFVPRGNPGLAALGREVALNIGTAEDVIGFCRDHAVDLVVVGPEAPLVAGLADPLAAAGIAVFGPSKAAAALEGSKDFTKTIAQAAGVPTAAHATFTDAAAALAHVRDKGAPIVVKYDGLMAGKGVTVASTLAEAEAAIRALHANEADARIVIEEMLVGEEASLFCLVDGETVLPFGSAQDHKRAFDGDRGPNTGGMGAYSPAPVMTPAMERRALDEIVIPTMREMVRRGTPYRGVIFAGLMITAEGPKLIEYNCRFGDPECQVLMLRLESDLLDLLEATARGSLAGHRVTLRPDAAVTIVLASQGYPGEYAKGSEIRGVETASAMPGVTIFHAGTRREGGRLLAAGGRVLNVSAVGADLAEAVSRAYAAVDAIDWPEGFCRRDIAARGLIAR